jgi:hypothetical protein
METHLEFLDYVKAFDMLKEKNFFEILQSKNIPNLLLKSIIQIYSGNTIKVKINNHLSEKYTIKHDVRKGCPISPTLFNINLN